jgi:ATP-binding cassette subfamily F protein 3
VQLKPLQKALQKTEKTLEALQVKLVALRSELADPAVYEADQQARLAALVKDEAEAQTELEKAEELWMEQQAAIEQASA